MNIGDVVRLKSGGPEMTVVMVTDEILTFWFNGPEGQLNRELFPFACLELAQRQPVEASA